MGVLNRDQQLPQVALHLGERPHGSVEQVVSDVLVLPGGTQRQDGQLWSEARMHGVASRDEYDVPGRALFTRLRDTVPNHGGNASGSVAERQLQVFAAVAAGAELDLAYEQRLGDFASLCKFPDLHGAGEDRVARGQYPWNAARSSREG